MISWMGFLGLQLTVVTELIVSPIRLCVSCSLILPLLPLVSRSLMMLSCTVSILLRGLKLVWCCYPRKATSLI
ncbi:hypothetical protein FB192DRAFT_1393327 [Mucor lusitanicus]|uniref:Uncharacterized protein n=1 Tax=Mucor circinelloides f. lusitanicus TaxID=29924 RepID=A0A8H4BB66_MUCCL|nr:hypothetical protein FB192DRAFT_1393327 [Mucor lusitanicus]